MNRLTIVFAVLVSVAPNLLPDADAGLFFRRCGAPRTPVRTVARAAAAVVRAPAAVVGAWSRSRAARGLPTVFPAVAAASGAVSACSACAVSDHFVETDKMIAAAAPNCRVLPDGSMVCGLPTGATSRRTRDEQLAGSLDGQFGHRVGRGPFRRALNASPDVQRRIVDRFNSTVGARNGVSVGSLSELIQWVADHQDQILSVVKLVIQIIGML